LTFPLTLTLVIDAKAVPLTCHGHSRPVPHLQFSSLIEEDEYYLISACKGESEDTGTRLRSNVQITTPCFVMASQATGRFTFNAKASYVESTQDRHFHRTQRSSMAITSICGCQSRSNGLGRFRSVSSPWPSDEEADSAKVKSGIRRLGRHYIR
jgi:hypothetical protein